RLLQSKAERRDAAPAARRTSRQGSARSPSRRRVIRQRARRAFRAPKHSWNTAHFPVCISEKHRDVVAVPCHRTFTKLILSQKLLERFAAPYPIYFNCSGISAGEYRSTTCLIESYSGTMSAATAQPPANPGRRTGRKVRPKLPCNRGVGAPR